MTESEEKLKGTEFLGIVENNLDLDKKQRIQIRIPYLHGSKELIPTEALPWAQPYRDNNGLTFSVPEINKIVNVTFPTGNPYYPVYKNAQHLNINLQKKIEEYDEDDYASFVALCYNYNTQIYINKTDGLNMYYNYNGLQIKNKKILLKLKDNTSILNLGNDIANQPIILGQNFFDWFDLLISELKTGYISTPAGSTAVQSPGLIYALAQYEANKNKFLSEHIYAVDNNKIDVNLTDIVNQKGDKTTFTLENDKNNINAKIAETTKPEEVLPEEDILPKVVQNKEDEYANEVKTTLPFSSEEKSDTIEEIYSEPPTPAVKQPTTTTNNDDILLDYDDYTNEEYNSSSDSINLFSEDEDLNEIEPDNIYTSKPYVPGSSSSSNPAPANVPNVDPATGNDLLDIKRMSFFLWNKGYQVHQTSNRLNIIGIRSSSKDNGYISNKFDDKIWVFYYDENKVRHLVKYDMTTAPGFKHKTTTIPKGVAFMHHGQYTYTKWKHNGKYACLGGSKTKFIRCSSNNYPSLNDIKTGKVKIYNDAIGLNIHRSSEVGSMVKVDNWSEGCQVFKNGEEYKQFMSLVNKQKESTYTYTLIYQTEFTEYVNTQYKKDAKK